MLEKKYNLKYVGLTYRTNQGYDVEIIDGGSKPKYVTVKINNDEVKEVQIDYLKKGITTYINHIQLYSSEYVGNTYKTNQGYSAKVIDGGSRHCYVTVKINEDEVKEVTIQALKKGGVTYINHISLYSSEHVGNTYVSNEGYQVECYEASLKPQYIKIKVPIPDNTFDNDGLLIKEKYYYDEVQVNALKEGVYKNKFHPSVHGKGYNSICTYSYTSHPVIYSTWNGMLERCYCPKSLAKYPTYKGTTVDDRFLNFQFFAKWYESHSIKGYSMDKDLKQVGVKNKIYSTDTICFISNQLNKFIANVYSNNTSGYTGVSLDKQSGKWIANINNNGKSKYLGRFTSKLEAANVYIKARNKQVYKWYNYYLNLQRNNQPLGNVNPDDILNLLMEEIPLEELIKDKDFDLSDYLDEDEEFQYHYSKWWHIDYETFKLNFIRQVYRESSNP